MEADITLMDCQATSHFSVSQCDFPAITGPISPAPIYVGVSCTAKRLLPQHRQDLAIQVLAGTETVSELARRHEVSRKFLYQQVHTAEEALSEAFAPSSRPDDVLLARMVLERQGEPTLPARGCVGSACLTHYSNNVSGSGRFDRDGKG
jgi:transposase-like protein